MLYIENKKEKVIVLKAPDSSDLRLFPGLNEIDVENKEELAPYLNTESVQALLNGYEKSVASFEKIDKDSNRIDEMKRSLKTVKYKASLRFVTEELDDDELKDAVFAREKNEMLNKSGLTIKKQAKEIVEKDAKSGSQQKQIDELMKANEKLLAGFNSMKKKIKEAGIEV